MRVAIVVVVVPVRTGIGDVFKLEYRLVEYIDCPMPAAQASVAACELSMGYVLSVLICQFIQTTALSCEKVTGIWVVRASVIQAAFSAPPSPASFDPNSASIMGLFGATETISS